VPVLQPGLGGAGGCAAAPALAGASWTLNLARAQPAHTLALTFRPPPEASGLHLQSSADGRTWVALTLPQPDAQGQVALPLPSGDWLAFRLQVPAGAAAPHWRLCQFTVR
ncbi:MAG: hypothetical protein ACRD1E_06470, partial [Terriglobales bacterium]